VFLEPEPGAGLMREPPPKIVEAHYNPMRRTIVINLSTGYQMTVPVGHIQGLGGATRRQLADIEIGAGRQGLRWPQLDVDLYLPGLLQGVTGSKRWMASLGDKAQRPALLRHTRPSRQRKPACAKPCRSAARAS
jgi:hypothetical protein